MLKINDDQRINDITAVEGDGSNRTNIRDRTRYII